MTEGQLRSKRDEFWDTAPAFEGRKEIWDALKAATLALESNDHELAQAIVDGASITLPHGEKSIHSCSYHICKEAGESKRFTYINILAFPFLLNTFIQVLSQSVTMNSGIATSCLSIAWLPPLTSSQSAVTRTPATALSRLQHPKRNSSWRYHSKFICFH